MARPLRLSLPAGLQLLPGDSRAAIRAGVLSVFGVCLFVAAIDGLLGAGLPSEYREYYTAPMWPRTLDATLGAVEEELLYRLLLMTTLVALPLLGRRQSAIWWIMVAIGLAQLVNVHAVVLVAPPWSVMRFWLVGCVWGWLYWRHGFVTALLAHGAVHLLLDPMLLVLLR